MRVFAALLFLLSTGAQAAIPVRLSVRAFDCEKTQETLGQSQGLGLRQGGQSYIVSVEMFREDQREICYEAREANRDPIAIQLLRSDWGRGLTLYRATGSRDWPSLDLIRQSAQTLNPGSNLNDDPNLWLVNLKSSRSPWVELDKVAELKDIGHVLSGPSKGLLLADATGWQGILLAHYYRIQVGQPGKVYFFKPLESPSAGADENLIFFAASSHEVISFVEEGTQKKSVPYYRLLASEEGRLRVGFDQKIFEEDCDVLKQKNSPEPGQIGGVDSGGTGGVDSGGTGGVEAEVIGGVDSGGTGGSYKGARCRVHSVEKGQSWISDFVYLRPSAAKPLEIYTFNGLPRFLQLQKKPGAFANHRLGNDPGNSDETGIQAAALLDAMDRYAPRMLDGSFSILLRLRISALALLAMSQEKHLARAMDWKDLNGPERNATWRMWSMGSGNIVPNLRRQIAEIAQHLP